MCVCVQVPRAIQEGRVVEVVLIITAREMARFAVCVFLLDLFHVCLWVCAQSEEGGVCEKSCHWCVCMCVYYIYV